MSLTLETFLSDQSYRNAWIEVVPGLKFYLRAYRRSHDTVVDLANMEATPPGRGRLRRFLPDFERICKEHGFYLIKIENIHNKRLIPFFERNGYHLVQQNKYDINMYKDLI